MKIIFLTGGKTLYLQELKLKNKPLCRTEDKYKIIHISPLWSHHYSQP